jgi:uncharacterized membrane protein
MIKPSILLSSAGLGWLAGMRSMTPPTLVSFYLNRAQSPQDGTLVDLLSSQGSLTIFALLAAGEITADKFPQAPSRIFTPALVGRLGTAALSSAALCEAKGQERWIGAMMSSVVAGVSSFATYRARVALNQQLPNVAAGVVEDLVLLGISWALLRQWQQEDE